MRRVHANLHCLLVMTSSPAGQQRLQQFPALATATQLHYIAPWSADALAEMAAQALAPLGAPEDVSQLVKLCLDLHGAACAAAAAAAPYQR